ncbi:MAG: hypothetical protein ACRBBQ_07325 [Cognatishimia sp.]
MTQDEVKEENAFELSFGYVFYMKIFGETGWWEFGLLRWEVLLYC